jgi:hypothetical protein
MPPAGVSKKSPAIAELSQFFGGEPEGYSCILRVNSCH